MPKAKHLIEMRDFVKTYVMGDNIVEAIKGISFTIDQGEMVGLVGGSGCGKSTTMNVIGLLSRQTSGEYFLNGVNANDLSPNKRAELRNSQIGFIFQQFMLLPRLTALQNVMLPLGYQSIRKKNAVMQAMTLLERVGMKEHAHHLPHELSGGQQQRVAIARALVCEPSLILGDEPTGALDSDTSEAVMELLHEMHKEKHVTVMLITHDPKVAQQCERNIYIVDGRISEKGVV